LAKAPDVYAAADLFIEAGDWIVHQMTGSFSRNACAAGYKGLWSEELGNPSEDFLKALDPALAGLNSKLVQKITAAGEEAGIPVSAAIIDAHSGVPGMGVSEAGPLCMIMGTSGCHMLPANDLHCSTDTPALLKTAFCRDFTVMNQARPPSVTSRASRQAVALGSAIFGTVAAGRARGGFDTASEAVSRMTRPCTRTFTPDPEAAKVYRGLFAIYKRCHAFFGKEQP
jgi:ribulose kinase